MVYIQYWFKFDIPSEAIFGIRDCRVPQFHKNQRVMAVKILHPQKLHQNLNGTFPTDP